MTLKSNTNGALLDEPYYDEGQPTVLGAEISDEVSGDAFIESGEEPSGAEATAEAPRLTQLEAMRQALADLGLGARNIDLAEYLRAKFGIRAKHIAVLKSQAKKALFGKDAQTEPVPASGPLQSPEPTPPTPLPATGSTAPKADLDVVRVGSVPSNGAPHSKRVILIPQTPAAQAAVAGVPEPTFALEEVQAVKSLCDRLGAGTLLALLDILGW